MTKNDLINALVSSWSSNTNTGTLSPAERVDFYNKALQTWASVDPAKGGGTIKTINGVETFVYE